MKKPDRPEEPQGLPEVFRNLGGLPARLDAELQDRLRQPILLRRPGPVLPADVSRYLQDAMLSPKNILEDARYLKVVPNDYLVELGAGNYEQRYRPILNSIREQWQKKLLDSLNVANSRQGRREYRFGGRVVVNLRPAPDLADDQVRILPRINPGAAAPTPDVAPACLELQSGGEQWRLTGEIVVIGRERPCDICLDMPLVWKKRLVSGRHATIRYEDNRFRLYDGSPDGRPSTNGTFVNGQRVSTSGRDLHDGDVIILAALDPQRPRPDTPGVVVLVFHGDCG